MTMLTVTEIRRPLEAVTHDPFADGMPSGRAWWASQTPRSGATAVTHEPHIEPRGVPAAVRSAIRL